MAKTKNPLARHVDEILNSGIFKTRRAIASALGMKESTFSKSVQEDGTLTVEQCIRFAGVTGGSLVGILQLIGRRDLARLANELIGPSQDLRLTRWERELIDEWRGSTETDRHALFAIARQLRRARGAFTGSPHGGAMKSLVRRLKADERAVAIQTVHRRTRRRRRKARR